MDSTDSREPPQQASPIRRPAKVTSLICEGTTYEGWAYHNKSKNRFFLVNLDYVLGMLSVDYTLTRAEFHRATEIILKETTWGEEYPSNYECSPTQIRPEKKHKAKHFGHCATIIVALELIAAAQGKGFNVYDWLRILPAWCFVDRFDAARLQQLKEYYDTWSDRDVVFGDDAKDRSFEELCLLRMDQPFSTELVGQMIEGNCITQLPAKLLVTFVENFPRHLHVGPVLRSGEDSYSQVLGTKRAAKALRYPKRFNQDRLGPRE